MTIYAKRPMQHACESKRENVRETLKRNSRKMREILELPYKGHASEGYWRGKIRWITAQVTFAPYASAAASLCRLK
jgi:hypothetical protein